MEKRDEKGAKKFEIIAPLMQTELGAAGIRRRRAEIMEEYSLSERTLRRYIAAYKKQGFAKRNSLAMSLLSFAAGEEEEHV